jgi:hypothetical protein
MQEGNISEQGSVASLNEPPNTDAHCHQKKHRLQEARKNRASPDTPIHESISLNESKRTNHRILIDQ